ncbi:hypothetical protein [Siminovitchia fortis]|uniref:hypothetical protein n=1 Tax=Siminovitchia fortis TaxID=254758 RepID=UPI0011A7BD68|nr:hypothetical protein [Siminovitchia fortis]
MMKPLKPLNITYLISSWLSISMIFIIGEVVIRFGVFSSLIIVCAFILAFVASFALQKFIALYSLGIKKSPILGQVILAIRFLEIYVLHLFVCGLIFHTLFQMNIYISVIPTSIILLVCAIYLPKGEKLHLSIKDSRFVLISGLAIILPTYIYLQKGLESLYHNLLYYQPHVLNHDSKHLWLLLLGAFFIFFSKLLLQGEAIVNYTNPNVKKGIGKLLIAVFIFCAFILAFATMNIVAITQNLHASHANELFILLIEKLSPSVVFKIFCLILYFVTLVILIDTLPSTDKGAKRNKIFNASFVLILLSVFITIAVFQHFSLLVIYAFFGLLISILVIAAIVIEVLRNRPRMSTKLKKSQQ